MYRSKTGPRSQLAWPADANSIHHGQLSRRKCTYCWVRGPANGRRSFPTKIDAASEASEAAEAPSFPDPDFPHTNGGEFSLARNFYSPQADSSTLLLLHHHTTHLHPPKLPPLWRRLTPAVSAAAANKTVCHCQTKRLAQCTSYCYKENGPPPPPPRCKYRPLRGGEERRS